MKAVCKGFHAGKEGVLKYYFTDEAVILASQIAGDGGECTLQFTIPASAAGNHNVLVQNQYDDTQRRN